MKLLLIFPVFFLLMPICLGQDSNSDSLITVIDHNWQRYRPSSKKGDTAPIRPARPMTGNDKNFSRNAREQLSKGAVDPHEYTVDGRSAALEKNVHDARTSMPEKAMGYTYVANVKNESDRKVDVVFWEYRFTELANPANTVRRQFLCAANMKPGESKELSVFSLLGPSDEISAESLSNSTGKLFDEKIFINRIEFHDGAVLQRRDWKYADVRKGVERATSTKWGKEVCRGI